MENGAMTNFEYFFEITRPGTYRRAALDAIAAEPNASLDRKAALVAAEFSRRGYAPATSARDFAKWSEKEYDPEESN
jgi:hypothetical protein